MRLALLSDIHGNPIALDAVLADIQAQGVDAYWVLGDIAAIDAVNRAHHPAATFITDHWTRHSSKP